MSQSKHWCFTLNNYTDDDEKRIKLLAEAQCSYLVYGREMGESGTQHLQGYLILKVKKRMIQVKALIGSNPHLEKKRGSVQQAADYCKKDGDYFEHGETTNEQGRRTDLDNVVAMVKDGKSMHEIAEQNPVEVIKYGRGIQQLKLHLEPTYAHDDVRGVWIYGPPGTGKSHSAREYDPNAYVKPQNKWWDGYQGEETVILDDLDTNVLGHYLKIWADKYACTGETKGGTCNLRHKKLIVTSNYSPEELWNEDEVMCEAIRRRFIMNFKVCRESKTRFD